MAYDSCGACLSNSVALAGSAMTRPFICERISKSCGAGSVVSVCEMALGQVSPGGRSTPGGRGGKFGCAICCP